MKKYLLVGFMLFFASNLFAQNEKTVGDWKVVNYRTVIDTTFDGKQEINTNPEAYKKGSKKLSPKYLNLKLDYPDEYGNGSFQIAITKDLGVLWFELSYNKGYLKKITSAPKGDKYLITKGDFTDYDLVIEYDEKTQHLLLIDEESGITMYEFSRK